MPFEKGNKLGGRGFDNVGGYNLPQLCRIKSKEAVDTLVKIMRNEEAPAAARVNAANAILDRGFGKAPTRSIAPETEQDALNLTDAELAAIASGRSEIAAGTTDSPPLVN